MKKKVIIIIVIVLLAIAGVITTICLLNRNSSEINKTKLEEDKIAIENGGVIINAKRVTNDQYAAKIKYEGEGYYILEYRGGEIVEYRIYDNNDNEIWSYDKHYPMTRITD